MLQPRSATIIVTHTVFVCIPAIAQGGALYISRGTVTITSTTFTRNYAVRHGARARAAQRSTAHCSLPQRRALLSALHSPLRVRVCVRRSLAAVSVGAGRLQKVRLARATLAGLPPYPPTGAVTHCRAPLR